MKALRILLVNANLDPLDLAGCLAIEKTLTELSEKDAAKDRFALELRIVPWRQVLDHLGRLQEEWRRWRPHGVIIGPNGSPFAAYPMVFDAFLQWLRRRRSPTLGICGGHQIIALAHGAPIAPVYPVPRALSTYEGMPKVEGLQRVRQLGDDDPLLEGLPLEFEVEASHVDEVKDIPPGFRLLGLGDPSKVQIIRADRRPIWGLQFHPERSPEPAKRILQNFLNYAALDRSERSL